MNSLIPYLTKLSDSRLSKGIRHQQTPTLVIMIMSLMCGYTSFNAMARFAKHHRALLATQIPLPRGKHQPSKDLAIVLIFKSYVRHLINGC